MQEEELEKVAEAARLACAEQEINDKHCAECGSPVSGDRKRCNTCELDFLRWQRERGC